MPTAKFSMTDLSGISKIDHEKGIIHGAKLAEVGRVAYFKNSKGEVKSMRVTPEIVDKLLGFASASGSLNAHWTHDYIDADKDPLHAKIGAWRDFSKDASGNLSGDLNLMPGDKRDAVLWAAANDPKGMMASVVFDYDENMDGSIVPTNLKAADLVERGAATTALLAATDQENDNKTTTNKNTYTMLSPEDKAEIAGMIKSAVDEVSKKDESQDAAMLGDEDMSAALEETAGVTDADRKSDNPLQAKMEEKQPAMLRAMFNAARATIRRLKTASDEAVVKAEARLSSATGRGATPVFNAGGDKDKHPYAAAVEKHLAAGAKTKGIAMLRAAKDEPAAYNDYMSKTSSGVLKPL